MSKEIAQEAITFSGPAKNASKSRPFKDVLIRHLPLFLTYPSYFKTSSSAMLASLATFGSIALLSASTISAAPLSFEHVESRALP